MGSQPRHGSLRRADGQRLRDGIYDDAEVVRRLHHQLGADGSDYAQLRAREGSHRGKETVRAGGF